MEQINSKQDLINYFEKGCKKENQLSIGVEHEKFIFDNSTNQRANFKTISKIFNFLRTVRMETNKRKRLCYRFIEGRTKYYT